MLIRFDPFREIDRLSQQMFAAQGRPATMPMDAYRHGDQFVLHFDIPGAETSAIEISVDHNVLTVQAERSWALAEEDEVVVQERPQGRFTRQVVLGDNLESEHIEARYEGGVLSLSIPVAERSKARRVEISGGEGSGRASAESVTVESTSPGAGSSTPTA